MTLCMKTDKVGICLACSSPGPLRRCWCLLALLVGGSAKLDNGGACRQDAWAGPHVPREAGAAALVHCVVLVLVATSGEGRRVRSSCYILPQ